MASNVASIPLAGSLAFVAGCGGLRRGFTQRVSFEAVPVSVCRQANPSRPLAVRGSAGSEEKAITGVVFEPFREVQSQSFQLPESAHESLARQRFHVSCESAINDQINVEYNVSYIYHFLFSYFDRDNIALPGLAKFFLKSSEEERDHAEKLMKYQNKRGGRVKLLSIVMPPVEFGNAEKGDALYGESDQLENKRGGRVKLLSIVMPPVEFGNAEKGDALYAMELTLSLEKLTAEKLYALHKVAEEAHDVQMTDYIESEFLSEQVESIRMISQYVAQLRRIGNGGHGVYHWDRVLLEEGA